MNLSKVFGIIFGAIIFFLIVYVVGIEKIIQSFKDFNFIYLPLILFILFIERFTLNEGGFSSVKLRSLSSLKVRLK